MAPRPSGPWSGHEWLSYLLLIAVPLLLVAMLYCFLFKKPFIKSLRGKHVFITGGSSGIGLAIGLRALIEGASVTLVSRSASNLSSAVDYLLHEAPGAQKELIRCEVADVADFEALSNAIERSFSWKPIDVFVCNAGLTRGGYLGDGQLRDVQITVQTNFMGVVNALHSALPLLKLHSRTQPVSVVIMASLASMFFMYGHAVYTATKYAMRGLAEGLRFELLPYNIRVSLICPGFTSTPFLDEAEREEEICELLKWVNLYFRKWAESADDVAASTVAAMKRGSFLVTTSALGFIIATLGRGFVPCQSFVRLVLELLFFVPFRLSSVVTIPIFRWIIRHKSSAPMSTVSLQDVVPVLASSTLDDHPTAAARTGTCSSAY